MNWIIYISRSKLVGDCVKDVDLASTSCQWLRTPHQKSSLQSPNCVVVGDDEGIEDNDTFPLLCSQVPPGMKTRSIKASREGKQWRKSAGKREITTSCNLIMKVALLHLFLFCGFEADHKLLAQPTFQKTGLEKSMNSKTWELLGMGMGLKVCVPF